MPEDRSKIANSSAAAISQSLAGRCTTLKLLPRATSEDVFKNGLSQPPDVLIFTKYVFRSYIFCLDKLRLYFQAQKVF